MKSIYWITGIIVIVAVGLCLAFTLPALHSAKNKSANLADSLAVVDSIAKAKVAALSTALSTETARADKAEKVQGWLMNEKATLVDSIAVLDTLIKAQNSTIASQTAALATCGSKPAKVSKKSKGATAPATTATPAVAPAPAAPAATSSNAVVSGKAKPR